MAYFDTKKDSLEEVIKAAVSGQINEEKVELEEGTTKVPTSMADFRSIMNLMKKPIKAKDAEKAVSKYIDDDYLANGIISIKQKDPNADARPAIMRGFNKLEISTMGEPSYGRQIKFNRNFEISDKLQKKRLEKSPSEDQNNMTRITLRGGAKVRAEELDSVNKTAVKKKFDDRKDKDIDNDGDVDSSDKYLHKRRKAISKAIKSEDADVNELSIADVKKATEKAKKRQEKERKATGKTSVSTADLGARKEAYEYGTKEATENSLNITPGQSTDDWNKQVGVMQEKQTSMREALAKMWGVEEGHNPFKKEEEKTPKKEAKTMTGKPVTKVSIGMKEK